LLMKSFTCCWATCMARFVTKSLLPELPPSKDARSKPAGAGARAGSFIVVVDGLALEALTRFEKRPPPISCLLTTAGTADLTEDKRPDILSGDILQVQSWVMSKAGATGATSGNIKHECQSS
jgi:hypothetical protein